MPQAIPPRLPESGDFAKLKAHINQIRDVLISLMPRNSFGTRTAHTSIGVSREAAPGQAEAPPSKQVWL